MNSEKSDGLLINHKTIDRVCGNHQYIDGTAERSEKSDKSESITDIIHRYSSSREVYIHRGREGETKKQMQSHKFSIEARVAEIAGCRERSFLVNYNRIGVCMGRT